tara:strand:+ start:330 stop:737 length:408 start_codon:yes stop_codon:yes gene_type:complete
MTRKSQYTNRYKKKYGKNPIPFPYFVVEQKKEVYFRIVTGFPASLTVKPIMREHFPDDYKGIIASDETWNKFIKDLPPHFLLKNDKKVVFLIKGVSPEDLILRNYMPSFPEGYKGMIIKCEESFYKLRMKANSSK